MAIPHDSTHRQVNPHLESSGSDHYTIKSYDPVFQVCDLYPAGSHQRGILKDVPIMQQTASTWETQVNHDPELDPDQILDPEQWGQTCRGPRAGTSTPVKPGDLALVQFLGESQSDPVIIGFLRWKGDYGIPWVANQTIGRRDDKYKQRLPQDDATFKDRYDFLHPSGSWVRYTRDGSITLSTAPADNARAFFTLTREGRIKIQARDEKKNNYLVRLEFTPNKEGNGEGRIAIGPEDDAANIWFTPHGDVHIRSRMDRRVSLLADGAGTQAGLELDAGKGNVLLACGTSSGSHAAAGGGDCQGLRGARAWDPEKTCFIQMNAEGDMQIGAPRSLKIYAGSAHIDVGG
jgi:hypothetical protein